MTVLKKWKMAKVGYILQCGRYHVDSLSCRLGMSRACVICCNLLGPHRVAWRVFATATWLGGCARVLTNLFVTAHVDDILNTDSDK